MSLELIARQLSDLQQQITHLTATVAGDVEKTKEVSERVKELKLQVDALIRDGRPATGQRLDALAREIAVERQELEDLVKTGTPPVVARLDLLEKAVIASRAARVTLIVCAVTVVLAIIAGVARNEVRANQQNRNLARLDTLRTKQDTATALVALSSVVACAKSEENQKLILATHRGSVLHLSSAQALMVSCDSVRTLLRKRLDGLAP